MFFVVHLEPPHSNAQIDKTEARNFDADSLPYREARSALLDCNNIRENPRLLTQIIGISCMEDGHYASLRDLICARLTELGQRKYTNNGVNKTHGNNYITSWRAACANRGFPSDQLVRQYQVFSSKCNCTDKMLLTRDGLMIFGTSGHNEKCLPVELKALEKLSLR